MSLQPYHRPLHLAALLTTAATFPLIFMGGLVTSKKAGMAVPDWPNSYGYNMFLFPPSQWVEGIFYEHAHRLMGTVVGFLSIILASFAWGFATNKSRQKFFLILGVASVFAAFVTGLILLIISAGKVPAVEHIAQRTSHAFVGFVSLAMVSIVLWLSRRPEPRRWVRWLCTTVLIAVIFQGILGGLRVVLVDLDLAVVHGIFAQAFFCLASLSALVTSRLWHTLPLSKANALTGHSSPTGNSSPRSNPEKQMAGEGTGPTSAGRNLARWSAALVAAIFLQLVVGATMRHYDAGLAIPDLPLHYGKVLPPTNETQLDEVNHWRADQNDPNLHPVRVTLLDVWLHFGHRVGAVVVTLLSVVVVWKSLRSAAVKTAARNPAVVLALLVLTQVTLGVLTVLLRKPADIASLHVACGALVLMSSFILAARCVRAFGWLAATPAITNVNAAAGEAAGPVAVP